MSYRTLLAHLPSKRKAPSILHAAGMLAERHGAHLIGVHVRPPLASHSAGVALPPSVIEAYTATRRAIADEIHQIFKAASDNRDFVAEWRLVEHMPNSIAHSVVEFGDTSDLLIIARESDTMVSGGDHESIVSLSSRPVLLMPPSEDPVKTLGERVLVAWDGSRESIGAIYGALPILVEAEEVRLQRINPPLEDRQYGAGLGSELASHLARHGVNVNYGQSIARSGEIGAELLRLASEMQADLVTMGCYGHARLRERLFGGTTRYILEKTGIPLLLKG